jgi:protein-S-isoprenylcysteine O-methyltransferase Ste14
MTDTAVRDATVQGDTAGVSVPPPPVLFALGLAAGFFVDSLAPTAGMPSLLRYGLGVPLLAAGVALVAWFRSTFRRARTPINLHRPTTAIVTSGPFRWTRNPAYVSLVLLYSGIALVTSTAWAIATLVPVLATVRYAVIAREERYLERKFGQAYREYRARTRRWL